MKHWFINWFTVYADFTFLIWYANIKKSDSFCRPQSVLVGYYIWVKPRSEAANWLTHLSSVWFVRRGQQRDSIEVTPTDTVPPPIPDDATLPSSASGAGGGLSSADVPVLPTQDEVVKKTEKITRNLQELFQSAQECKHEWSVAPLHIDTR